MSLKVSQRVEGTEATVRVSGELDMHTAPDLDDVLVEVIDGGAERVVVDLSGLDFLDSTGLATILAGHQRITAKGGSLTLDGPSRYIIKMLDITGLDKVFEVRVSPKAAEPPQAPSA